MYWFYFCWTRLIEQQGLAVCSQAQNQPTLEVTPTKSLPDLFPFFPIYRTELHVWKNVVQLLGIWRINLIELLGYVVRRMLFKILSHSFGKKLAPGEAVVFSELFCVAKQFIRDRDCCFHDMSITAVILYVKRPLTHNFDYWATITYLSSIRECALARFHFW